MKAFPAFKNGLLGFENQGMDLRDYFAAKATEQDIEPYQWRTEYSPSGHGVFKTQVRTREEAKYAYADAMMKARDE